MCLARAGHDKRAQGVKGRALFALVLMRPQHLLELAEFVHADDTIISLRLCIAEVERLQEAVARSAPLSEVSAAFPVSLVHPRRELLVRLAAFRITALRVRKISLLILSDAILGLCEKENGVVLCVDLYGASVRALTASRYGLEFCNKADHDTVIVRLESVRERDVWLHRLQSHQRSFKPDRNQWMDDSAAIRCCVCARHFTVFRRRHHCRRWYVLHLLDYILHNCSL